MIEEILKSFDEKFVGYPPDGTVYSGMPTSFIYGDADEAKSFLTQELLALQEKTREETAKEIANLAFQDIKDPNTERDYELVLYYCKKIEAKYLSKNTKETDNE